MPTLKKYAIEETCTYEIEAESMEAAKDKWLVCEQDADIWELMKKSFIDVRERSIEELTPNEDGSLNPSEEF